MPACQARVKVNLYLHVGPRRKDGLHEIDSLVIFPPIGDHLTITPTTLHSDSKKSKVPMTLQIDGPFAPHLADLPPSENLIYKAALTLYRHCPDHAFPVHIKLTKNVPPASGLGGGTADAMAALYMLNKRWNINACDRTLLAFAFEIGADGPACLMSHLVKNKAVHVTGAGERIQQVAESVTNLSLLLVNPGKAVSTGTIFHQLATHRASADVPYADWPRATPFSNTDIDMPHLMRTSTNDLQKPAITIAPEIKHVLTKLAQAPGCQGARMSGSGATCFGLYTHMDMARAACETFSDTPYWYALAQL